MPRKITKGTRRASLMEEDPCKMLLRGHYNDSNVQLFEDKYAKVQRKSQTDIERSKKVREKLCKKMLQQN